MTSYTSNSKSLKTTGLRSIQLYALSAITILVLFLVVEFAVRKHSALSEPDTNISVAELMEALPQMNISGREIGNQMLVQNVALFSQIQDPKEVTMGYVGTSRSKVIRPEHFGLKGAVVGAGNTYNEITYGLLLQAEILRLKFPNLKRVYFETSMLLRRPARLIVEEDHRKYIPLLRSLSPLCSPSANIPGCATVFESLNTVAKGNKKILRSELLTQRSNIRFSSLIKNENNSIPVLSDPLLAGLNANGERKNLSVPLTAKANQVKEITNENVKVQRLRDINSYAPWDGLFDLIALWGKAHNIEIVLFQPPVRSDLYKYQLQYGLDKHTSDLRRVAEQYAIPFIDLNRPQQGFMEDWSIFSDEDHMETCVGSGLLTLALDEGYQEYLNTHTVMPDIRRSVLEEREKDRLSICNK